MKACAFDALHIEDGIAVVDREKCKACGKCITACPQHLIDLVPYEQKTLVKCKCEQKGKAVITGCDAGCISCMKCVKNCPADAITMENNVAKLILKNARTAAHVRKSARATVLSVNFKTIIKPEYWRHCCWYLVFSFPAAAVSSRKWFPGRDFISIPSSVLRRMGARTT